MRWIVKRLLCWWWDTRNEAQGDRHYRSFEEQRRARQERDAAEEAGRMEDARKQYEFEERLQRARTKEKAAEQDRGGE